MILPQGLTLSEADFNKFMSVFEQIIEKAIDRKLKEGTKSSTKAVILSKKLTNEQTKVVELMFEGKNNKEMAKILGITESAVKNRLTAVYKKYGVGSRSQLLLLNKA